MHSLNFSNNFAHVHPRSRVCPPRCQHLSCLASMPPASPMTFCAAHVLCEQMLAAQALTVCAAQQVFMTNESVCMHGTHMTLLECYLRSTGNSRCSLWQGRGSVLLRGTLLLALASLHHGYGKLQDACTGTKLECCANILQHIAESAAMHLQHHNMLQGMQHPCRYTCYTCLKPCSSQIVNALQEDRK